MFGGDTGIAKSSDKNGVEIASQHLEAVGRDGGAVGKIAIGAPIEVSQLNRGAGGLDDINSLRE